MTTSPEAAAADEAVWIDQISHPRARQFAARWDEWRAGRRMPLRSQLLLREIKQVIPNVLILERHPVRQSYRIRLAGTEVSKLLGRETTGENFLSLWPDDSAALIGNSLDALTGHCRPLVLTARGGARDGRQVAFEAVFTPVGVDGRRTVQALGVMLPLAEPFWLGDYSLTVLKLMSCRNVSLSSPATRPLLARRPLLYVAPID